MARRSEHSREQIKQLVLGAAEEIVQEQGFAALKVRKIAADIGYTVGSIYMVFSCMSDLHMQIKARTWQKLAICLSELEAPVSAAEHIENMALAYLEFAGQNIGLWRMLFEHQLPVGESVPDEYLQACESVTALFYNQFRQLPVVPNAQIEPAVQVFTKALQGVCMQLIMHDLTPESFDKARQELLLLVHCYLRGYLQR